MEMTGRARMDMESGKREKAHMRREMLEKRAKLGQEYCLNGDRAILERLVGTKAYRQADVIFTYVSIKREVDTRRLICRALDEGKRVAVPRCGGRGVMTAYYIEDMGELEPGAYGILEPGTECPEARPEDMKLAVTPCVCCSESGFRLGYGGGYYDRYLPKTPAVRIALCREKMMVGQVPLEEHDCGMDFVITERRVVECQGH